MESSNYFTADVIKFGTFYPSYMEIKGIGSVYKQHPVNKFEHSITKTYTATCTYLRSSLHSCYSQLLRSYAHRLAPLLSRANDAYMGTATRLNGRMGGIR